MMIGYKDGQSLLHIMHQGNNGDSEPSKGTFVSLLADFQTSEIVPLSPNPSPVPST